MSTVVVTQSFGFEKSRQGVEIRYYDEVFSTLLPRFMNNASPAVSENGRTPENSKKIGKNLLFHDLNSYDSISQSALFRLDNNITQVGQDTIEFVPNHVMEKRDFGKPSLFDYSTPFQDYKTTDAIGYLTMQGDGTLPYARLDLNYPYILDLRNPIDPHTYDGVIEPFTIRSWDTLQNEDKPLSSRKVKGAISNYKEDQFGFCTPIEQKRYFYNENFRTRPYLEFGDFSDRLVDIKTGYFHDELEEFTPYIESTLESKLEKIIDEEIAKLIAASKQDNDTVGKMYISSVTGYTFIDNQNGTDSIAFLDQRGY